jgi:D-amino-acid dehydrogenase
MAEFIAAIPRHEENTITTVRMAIAARGHLRRLAAEAGVDFDCEERGILHFYKTKADFEDARRTSILLAKGGLERRAVTPSEMRDIEPALHGDLYGGWYTPSDFTGDIHKFTNGLAEACERLGVAMRLSTQVLAVNATETEVVIRHRSTEPRLDDATAPEEDSRFDKIIVCSGVLSRDLAHTLGDRVNVYPVKGYSITVSLPDAKDQEAAPWVSLLDDNAKIVTSRLGRDRFRVAGTAEFNGANRDIRAERVAPLVAWCRAHFPGMSTRHAVPWAGLRPMMPDMMPRVMQGRNARVFYNTGHGHLGWTLSAATADAVAALATGRANV